MQKVVLTRRTHRTKELQPTGAALVWLRERNGRPVVNQPTRRLSMQRSLLLQFC
jgi:hypothetical protein